MSALVLWSEIRLCPAGALSAAVCIKVREKPSVTLATGVTGLMTSSLDLLATSTVCCFTSGVSLLR